MSADRRAELADLAEARLDRDIADDAWERLLAEHGAPLAEALVRAQATRQALRALPRPSAPAAMREAILARTVAAPRPRLVSGGGRAWWLGAAALAAACLAVGIALHPGDAAAPGGTGGSDLAVARAEPAQGAAAGADRQELRDKDFAAGAKEQAAVAAAPAAPVPAASGFQKAGGETGAAATYRSEPAQDEKADPDAAWKGDAESDRLQLEQARSIDAVVAPTAKPAPPPAPAPEMRSRSAGAPGRRADAAQAPQAADQQALAAASEPPADGGDDRLQRQAENALAGTTTTDGAPKRADEMRKVAEPPLAEPESLARAQPEGEALADQATARIGGGEAGKLADGSAPEPKTNGPMWRAMGPSGPPAAASVSPAAQLQLRIEPARVVLFVANRGTQAMAIERGAFALEACDATGAVLSTIPSGQPPERTAIAPGASAEFPVAWRRGSLPAGTAALRAAGSGWRSPPVALPAAEPVESKAEAVAPPPAAAPAPSP